jgi:transcriptional regulator with XRE-family HTH domain
MEMTQMSSFQIILSPNRRAAGRFINSVRRAILKALSEERKKTGLTQSDIARVIGVHRSVISRQVMGREDISLGRVAEFAYAMGRKPFLELREQNQVVGTNSATSTTPDPLSYSQVQAIRPSQLRTDGFSGMAIAA